jgi:hypothetical protein
MWTGGYKDVDSMRFFLLLIVAMFLAAGCGGSDEGPAQPNPPSPPIGGDGGDDADPDTDPDPDDGDEDGTDEDTEDEDTEDEEDPTDGDTDGIPAIAGIWNGFAPTASGDSIQLSCLITTKLDIGCHYTDYSKEYEGVAGMPGAISGKVVVSDDGNVTASGQAFEPTTLGPVPFEVTSGAVSDDLLTFSVDIDGTTYAFESYYDAAAYERPSSFELVEGVYSGIDIFTSEPVSLVINHDGQVQASTGTCNGVGEIGPADASRNEYDVTFLDLTCDGDPGPVRYTGVAFGEDLAAGDGSLTFVIAADEDAAFGSLVK